MKAMIPCFFGRLCFFLGLHSLAGKRRGLQRRKKQKMWVLQVLVNMAEHG